MRRVLVVLFVIVSVLLGTHAQAAPKRVALVIGQNGYTGGMSVLANPINDARRMAGLLAAARLSPIERGSRASSLRLWMAPANVWSS